MPTHDANTSITIMNSSGLNSAHDVNQLICQRIILCHNVFSLSSEYLDTWPYYGDMLRYSFLFQ